MTSTFHRWVPFIAVLAAACGWGPIETDKHPDWPAFPKLESVGWKVTALDAEAHTLALGDQLIAWGLNGQLTIFDKKMNVQRTLDGTYDTFRLTDGNVLYAIRTVNYEKVLMRFDGFDGEGWPIAPHPLRSDKDTLAQIQSMEELEQCAEWARRYQTYADGYECVLRVGTMLVFRYPGNEVAVDMSETTCLYKITGDAEAPQNLLGFIFSEAASFRSCKVSDSTAYVDNHDVLEWLDSATIERHSSGNHFVFGFYLSGYSYYNFHSGENKVSFKAYQPNLPEPGLRLIQPSATPDARGQVFHLHAPMEKKVYRMEPVEGFR